MKIVLFHPAQLPPRDYGGVERVVLWLAKGLVELGHEVHVAALAGSRLPEGARLLPVAPDAASAHDLIPRLPAGVDVVHFQAPPEAGALEKLPCAGLLTVHGNGKPGETFPANTVFLSRDHATRHGATEFVYNGIDPAEYRFDPPAKGRDFLFLSRTGWRVKNVRGAVALCAEARKPLVIAGGHRPFTTRLRALLTPAMRWEGPVSGARKADLLATSRALVFPILWPEPFGLVMVEALMSGTPVIATKLGSVAELVPPDVGAALDREDRAGWLEWLGREHLPWRPERCREWAMAKFHYLEMARAYERLYKRLRAGEKLLK